MRRREFLKTGAGLAALKLKAEPRTSCIFLLLTGGPSQLDTWDMKPDAPSEIRGPFRPIKTNVPGIEISEIFPLMARQADKFALIRSVYHDGPAIHDVGSQLIQTGSREADPRAPHVGDAVARTTGSLHVVLPHPGSPSTDFGQRCVAARRLIECGARFVTVNMFDTVFGQTTWDSHGSAPFSTIADYRDHVGPMFDRAFSSLITGLDRSGLLETTLVVAAGEFGRNPKINPAGGRDHWPQCWTVLMAGAGIKGGQVYGSSDRIGAEPRDHPVEASAISATISHVMGVDPAVETHAAAVTQLFA